MSFSFGFSGDDIEEDPNDVQNPGAQHAQVEQAGPPPIQAKRHELNELLSTLPDKLSYTLHTTTSPKGHSTRLPRRDLYDIRLQLMAEDDLSSTTPQHPSLAALSSTDLTPNIYEGGYKTWECSLDLVSFLLDRGPRKDLDDMARVNQVVELGCGTAMPSCMLLEYAVREGLGIGFVLCDYNEEVLRCVSLANLLMTWVKVVAARDENVRRLVNEDARNLWDETEGTGNKQEEEEAGFLVLTPELLSAFTTSLLTVGITLTFISGSWTPVPNLLSLIPSSPELNTLVLASETIYSPASLTAFSEALAGLLKRVKAGKAVVAAKRVYFGVGGSVDAFREEASRLGCVAYEVDFEGLESGGVRRCLVEVQMY
ncbi:hypothetical protein M011DRAFT_464126 [Sporormia fimetaria CBS 119925]|uniref:protein-histidine N-methyltransferase n=1 Tax=Sporormia fimetaria CBS 119925 TaxID=1340428 RepID=A0A6A6VNR3_9PLEO|nr:hypothetical protein M011DRAFT_464126 [Sporormia fimetaria CBS 119925]